MGGWGVLRITDYKVTGKTPSWELLSLAGALRTIFNTFGSPRRSCVVQFLSRYIRVARCRRFISPNFNVKFVKLKCQLKLLSPREMPQAILYLKSLDCSITSRHNVNSSVSIIYHRERVCYEFRENLCNSCACSRVWHSSGELFRHLEILHAFRKSKSVDCTARLAEQLNNGVSAA